MRPLIGITTYREPARWGSWDVPAVLLPAAYSDAVAESGGEPILLPTGGSSADVVTHLDGLVIAGGADIDPALYDQQPGAHTTVVRPDRDDTELALLETALEHDLPLLAICRGMQLLNVALGGDLVQHLPDVGTAACHDPGAGLYQERTVATEPGTQLHRLIGASAEVHCHHHQALDRLAPGLTVSARAEDGIVEGVELTARRFCLAVQWHPEESTDRRLFEAHVAAARERLR